MSVLDKTINAHNVSDAWRQVAGALLHVPGRKAAHLVVRIADGAGEDSHTRAALDALMAQHRLQTIETVANTIFPASIAARHGDDPAALAERYRTLMPTLMRLNRNKNRFGTYFGRMVAYPGPGGSTVDQLTGTIDKLRTEIAGGSAASSRYEVAYQTGEDITRELTGADDARGTGDVGAAAGAAVVASGAALTYSPLAKDDRRRMGFPCLSLASFHLDGDTVHLAAHYRNQSVIERAYGNYLGLGRLHAYIAKSCGLHVGELLVVSGHIELERTGGIDNIVNGQQSLLV
jgi:hypothetical protein